MSRHIAFVNIPAHGHVTPTIAVVAELVRRGHRVTYATTEEFAPAVREAGGEVLVVESTLTSTHPKTEVSADDIAWLPLILLNESMQLTPALLEHFTGDTPDLVVYDVTTYPVARVLSRLLGRPLIELFPTFAANDRFSIAKVAEQAAGVAADHPATAAFRSTFTEYLGRCGLGGVELDSFIRGGEHEPRLVFLTREFQYAGDTFDDRFVFTGPCLSERGYQGGWAPPADELPLVYVSLGTAHNLRPEFYRTCVEAFAEEPVHVVMSIGGRTDPASLGTLPDRIEVHARVPQLSVLEHANAFVCHAGMGSTMEALYFGTPLVAVPQMPEQDAVARRIAELGLGVALGRDEVSPYSLCKAVRDVTTDEELHARLAVMRTLVREAGGTRRAADRIDATLAAAVRTV